MKQPLAIALVAGLVFAIAFGIYQLQQSNALSNRISDAEQEVKYTGAQMEDIQSRISNLVSKQESLASDATYWKEQYYNLVRTPLE
jgi:sensor domain CHASE-containing protein